MEGRKLETPIIPEGFKLKPKIPEGFKIRQQESTKVSNEPSVVKDFAKGSLQTLENIGQVYPALETAAAFTTQLYGVPASGLVALGTLAVTRDLKKATDVQHAVGKTLVYEPQTERGKQLSEAAFYPFIKLHEAGLSLGDWALKKTNSPTLAALAASAPEGILAILGGRHALKSKTAKSTIIEDATRSEKTKVYKQEFTEKFLKDEGIETLAEEVKKTSEIKEIPKEIPQVVESKITPEIPEGFKIKEKSLDIPEFKSGEAAERFGEQATPEQVAKLKELYKESREKTTSLPKFSDESQVEALKGQRYREAFEKAEEPKTKSEIIKEDLKPAKLTNEEQFIADVDGVEGLKKAAVERKVENTKMEEGTNRLQLIKERVEIAKEKKRQAEIKKIIEEGEELDSKQSQKISDEEYLLRAGEENFPDIFDEDSTQYGRDVDLTHIMREDGVTLYGGIPVNLFKEAYTKTIGEPVWDNLLMKQVPKVLEKIPGGKSIKRALIYDYRGDLPDTPTYMTSLKDMKHNQNIGRSYALDLGNRLQDMPERSQLVVGDRLRGLDVKMLEYEADLAMEARNALDSLGKQAVETGLLDEKVFFENVGKYLPRLYTSKEYKSQLTKWGLKNPNHLEMSRFMKRKDMPKELRKEMGEIMTPSFPVAKGIVQLTHDIELAKHFNGIAANPKWSIVKEPVLNKTTGKKIPFKTTTYDSITGKPIIKQGIKKDYIRSIPEGWEKLPKNKKLGQLSEAYVHPEIAADINLAIKISSKGEKVWRKTLGAWKFGKVILSPKTHARNLMSNSLLSHLGGMPLWRQPYLLTKSAKEMRHGGKFWKRATTEGMLESTFVEGELKVLFDRVEGNLKGLKAESLSEGLGAIGKAWEYSKIGANKAAKLYNAEEQWFKLAKFIDNVERRKMTDRAAAADATKWLFDYRELTKAQEAYRSKWYGAPFATFTIKAIPRIAEAAIKTPWRFAAPAAIIYALERAASNKIGDSKEERLAKRKLRPEWMQGTSLGMPNFPRVPVVDKSGREYYLNLSYIVPWGDIGESGGVGPIPGGLMPLSMPVVKEGMQQILNYDNFWKEPIVKESDIAGKSESGKRLTNLKKRGRHVYNTVAPTIAIDVEKGIDAARGTPDFRGRERPASVVAADVFLGLKMYPVDYAEQMMREVGKLNPNTSNVARQILSEIRTLAAKRNNFAEHGNKSRVEKLDKQVQDKVKQLQGLGAELTEKGKTYEQIKPQIPDGFKVKGK